MPDSISISIPAQPHWRRPNLVRSPNEASSSVSPPHQTLARSSSAEGQAEPNHNHQLQSPALDGPSKSQPVQPPIDRKPCVALHALDSRFFPPPTIPSATCTEYLRRFHDAESTIAIFDARLGSHRNRPLDLPFPPRAPAPTNERRETCLDGPLGRESPSEIKFSVARRFGWSDARRLGLLAKLEPCAPVTGISSKHLRPRTSNPTSRP